MYENIHELQFFGQCQRNHVKFVVETRFSDTNISKDRIKLIWWKFIDFWNYAESSFMMLTPWLFIQQCYNTTGLIHKYKIENKYVCIMKLLNSSVPIGYSSLFHFPGWNGRAQVAPGLGIATHTLFPKHIPKTERCIIKQSIFSDIAVKFYHKVIPCYLQISIV